MKMFGEQGFLRISAAATVAVAAFGIVSGPLSGSYSIAFDGAYSLVDAGMTLLAVWVCGLIVKSGDAASPLLRERFTMGLWHLEPMVLALNGALLVTVATYALINAVITALHGGNEPRFGIAIVYAAVTVAVCAAMAAAGVRLNRRLRSDFVALDVKAWVMSGGIALALLIAFLIGYGVADTRFAWFSHYVDPLVLACVCLAIIPIPVKTVLRALSEILLISPADLRLRVNEVAEETVRREGFLSYRSYVAKVGRAMQVEIHFIVPKALPARTVEEWDRIREEVGRGIGDDGPDRWLTIAFTADVRWAE
jgi:predicted Co/Zn/Cd cation transporter (cation efflux family)